MKKKIIAIFLTALLAVTMLAACGSSGGAGGSGTVSGAASGTGNAKYTLKFPTSFSENEYAGQLIQHFAKYLSEKSNGEIILDVYYGGTYCGMMEELSFVQNGAADMIMLAQASHTDTFPLLNYPSLISGDYQTVVDYMNALSFEGAGAAAIEAEADAQNVHLLKGCVANGSNVFITKKPYTSLAEMKGLSLGVGMSQASYQAMGFNVVTMMPWDYYNDLSRGKADSGAMSLTALVSMSLYEVTPYFISQGNYAAGNFIAINKDVWNSMDADTQALFQEAEEDLQAFSLTLAAQLDEEAVQTIKDKGGDFIELSAEDYKTIEQINFEYGVQDARTYAAAAGCEDDMEVILQEAAERLGYELPQK